MASAASNDNERSNDALHMQDDGAERVALPAPNQEVGSAANEIEKRTTRVGICFADYETFWWAADRPEQSACPACSTEDEDYAANHRFYVAEEQKP